MFVENKIKVCESYINYLEIYTSDLFEFILSRILFLFIKFWKIINIITSNAVSSFSLSTNL